MKKEDWYITTSDVLFGIYQLIFSLLSVFVAVELVSDQCADSVAWICGSAIIMWYIRWGATLMMKDSVCHMYRRILWAYAPLTLLAISLMPLYTRVMGYEKISYYTLEQSYQMTLAHNVAAAVFFIFMAFAIVYVWQMFKSVK